MSRVARYLLSRLLCALGTLTVEPFRYPPSPTITPIGSCCRATAVPPPTDRERVGRGLGDAQRWLLARLDADLGDDPLAEPPWRCIRILAAERAGVAETKTTAAQAEGLRRAAHGLAERGLVQLGHEKFPTIDPRFHQGCDGWDAKKNDCWGADGPHQHPCWRSVSRLAVRRLTDERRPLVEAARAEAERQREEERRQWDARKLEQLRERLPQRIEKLKTLIVDAEAQLAEAEEQLSRLDEMDDREILLLSASMWRG